MHKNIHNIIKSEYEKRQKISFDGQMQRIEEIYAKIPRIEQIDSEMRFTGIKYNKMILMGQNSDNTLDELLEMLNSLKHEKLSLLNKHSFPLDYLDPKYLCSDCKDTGFIATPSGTTKCTCYKQLYINHLFNQSNLKLLLEENFSSFNENFYPVEVNEPKYGIKISPRENILRIKNRVLNFIENIDKPEEKNIFFCGATGVGKSFMINCIASELLSKGRTVLYQTAPYLFKIINEYRLRSFKDDDGYEDSSYENIFNVDLLIIDDLGTESPSAARYAELLNILNTRQENNLVKACKTIISTNIGINKLHEYYDERVASRIIGGFDLFKFAGQDIRMLKKNEPKP